MASSSLTRATTSKNVNGIGQRDVLCGWGGAGAFSDGKLNISTEVGGYLSEFLDRNSLIELLHKTDGIFVKYGAPNRIFGDSAISVEEIADQSRTAGLEFIPTVIRHIGTENCKRILNNMRKVLDGKVEVRTCSQVQSLLHEDGEIRGVKLASGNVINGEFVVVAPGRVGANWMKGEADALGTYDNDESRRHWRTCGAARNNSQKNYGHYL